MLSVPVYSPLCDTDLEAYKSYCIATIGYNGSNIVRNNQGRVCGHDGEDYCGGYDTCKRVISNIFAATGVRSASMDDFFIGGAVCGAGAGGSDAVADELGDKDCHVGLSSGVAVDDGCLLADDHSDKQFGVTSNKTGEVLKSENDGHHVDGTGRGKNWARNQEWKIQKKEKKKRRQERKKGMDSQNWREKPQPVGFTSYFSGLDDETQLKLKQSRAAYLIAKNERELNTERARIAYNNSDVNKVNHMLRAMKVNRTIGSVAKSIDAGGWAKTVSDSVVKSEVESVGSAVSTAVSLDSVEFKVTSSQDSNSDLPLYKEFEKKRNEYLLCLSVPGVDRQEIYDKIEALTVIYGDDRFSPEEKKGREIAQIFVERFVNKVGVNCCSDALEACGYNDLCAWL